MALFLKLNWNLNLRSLPKPMASVLFAALAAFSLGTTPAVAAPADTVMVTEAFHTLLYLPLYVAKHEGIFERNGINVPTIRAAGSGPTALTSVMAGEAQFSVHGPEHVGFAQERGGHAKAVSAVANSAPVWILSGKDVQVASAADLKGKRVVVGMAPGTSNTLLKRWLRSNGMDETKDITMIEVQNGTELGPILAGRADVAVLYQPQVEQGLSQGLKIDHAFTSDYPQYAFSTVNTSQKIIDTQPDMVKRFVKSIDESLILMRKDPATAKQVARQEFPGVDGAIVDAAVQRMIEAQVYPVNTTVTQQAFDSAIDTQKFIGNIKTDMKYTDVVDPDFFAKQ